MLLSLIMAKAIIIALPESETDITGSNNQYPEILSRLLQPRLTNLGTILSKPSQHPS